MPTDNTELRKTFDKAFGSLILEAQPDRIVSLLDKETREATLLRTVGQLSPEILAAILSIDAITFEEFAIKLDEYLDSLH